LLMALNLFYDKKLAAEKRAPIDLLEQQLKYLDELQARLE